MSQPVNHHGCDLNRLQARTHEQPQQPTRSLLLYFAPQSSPSSICYFASPVRGCRHGHHQSPSSSSASNLVTEGFWVLAFWFPCCRVVVSPIATSTGSTISYCHYCCRSQIVWSLSPSISLPPDGTRVSGDGFRGRWTRDGRGNEGGKRESGCRVRNELRKWAPLFVLLHFSFISSYYY